MAIKAIVELRAKAGRRAELKRLIESMLGSHASGMAGFLGSTMYEALDDPDLLVEIAEWQSAEARVAAMQNSALMPVFAPVFDLLDGPFRATLVKLP